MRMIEFIQGFEEHSQLNPKIWNGNQLRDDVKVALLRIAQEFVEFIDVSVEVIDVLVTGGQVSYHYTKYSDLDLHLVIDYDAVECDQEVAELLDAKRLLFKEQHKIEIHGIPVEPGTEDAKRPSVSAAYSLKSDSWIRTPVNHSGRINAKEVQKQAEYWAKIIRSVLNQNEPEMAKKTLKLLRKYRKMGLKVTGEYGPENLAYKALRNQNLIKKLADRVNQDTDRSLSLGPKE